MVIYENFLSKARLKKNFSLPIIIKLCRPVRTECSSLADPGFSPGGRQLPKLLLFFTFLPKTAWKWKNLDPGGGAHPWRPPWIRQCSSCRVVYLDSVAMNQRGRAWQGARAWQERRQLLRTVRILLECFLVSRKFQIYCVRCSCNMKTNPTYSLIAQRKGSFNGKKPTCVKYQVTHRSGNQKKLTLQFT